MTSPNTFSLSPRVLATLGISIAQLCERAGVAQSNAWLTDDFFRLWKTADEVFQDRSAGIRFGAEGINRGYAVAAIVALHAPDFRHALAALSRYKRLTCPEIEQGHGVRSTIHSPAKEAAVPAVLEEAGMVDDDRLSFIAADLLTDQG